MARQITRAEWQAIAATLLEHYRTELARYGVVPGPDLHLKADESTPYSYCDLETGQISLNLPGTDRFPDLLMLMAVGSLVGTQETVRFLLAMMPYLLGHELAHYLRERQGALSPNHWVEEHAANRVGMALACTVPSFTAELPFLRSVAEGARERLPLREGEVTGALRETHSATLAEVEAFVRMTGAEELEVLRAAGLEAEVAVLSEQRAEAAEAFNQAYLTDAMAYMRRQLAWFCALALEPEPPALGAALEAHVLTASWEERLAAESAAALARLTGARTNTSTVADPAQSRAELLAWASGPDDRLRALALEQLAHTPDHLRSVLERAGESCQRYAQLQASAAAHGAPPALRDALADAHWLALEVGAEAAATLAGVPLHVVRAGLSSHGGRAVELTLRLIRKRLAPADRAPGERLSAPGSPTTATALAPVLPEPDFRRAVLQDPDPLVATAAGAVDRVDGETLQELGFFRRAPLLRPLRGEELLPLAQAAAEVRRAPGEVLARKGEPPAQVFLGEDGRLHGLVEALAGFPLRKGLKMPARGRMLAIDAGGFLDICRGEPKLARTIATYLAQRLRPSHQSTPPHSATSPNRPLLPAEKALALLETELFQGQDARALLRIAEAFVTRFYPPGAALVEAGAEPRLIVLVGAGTVLGDAECLTGRPWREGLIAKQRTVTLEAERADFLRLLYQLEGLSFPLAVRQARSR